MQCKVPNFEVRGFPAFNMLNTPSQMTAYSASLLQKLNNNTTPCSVAEHFICKNPRQDIKVKSCLRFKGSMKHGWGCTFPRLRVYGSGLRLGITAWAFEAVHTISMCACAKHAECMTSGSAIHGRDLSFGTWKIRLDLAASKCIIFWPFDPEPWINLNHP